MTALIQSFQRNMAHLIEGEEVATFAIAVSGGADSMALALLAHQWAQEHGVAIHALIVDHGLRAESADEALQVKGWLEAKGIAAHSLEIDMGGAQTAMQETARDKRYGALTAWCHAHDVHHMLLGHHRGDQAETVLFRLLRQSRFDGLAGMAARRDEQGVALLRPFLNVPKADLQSYVQSQSQPWVEDPSNQNVNYSRVQMRQLIAAYSDAEERLAAIARGFARIRSHTEKQLQQMLQLYVTVHDCGIVEMKHAMLNDVSPDMVDRLLVDILMLLSGSRDIPRLSKVADLRDQLMQVDAATLHGCELKRQGDGWLVYSETSRIAADQPLIAGSQRWGGFVFDWPRDVSDYSIGHLRESERVELKDKLHFEHPITVRSIFTLPVIRHLDLLQAIPHIGYYSDDWVEKALNISFKSVKPLGNLPFFAMNDANLN